MTTLPPDLGRGKVVARLIEIVGDGDDEGRDPDAQAPLGVVRITPRSPFRMAGLTEPTYVLPKPIGCGVDEDGYLIDPQGERGVWLIVGNYRVTYEFPEHKILAQDIEVTEEHTDEAPLDLTTVIPMHQPMNSTTLGAIINYLAGYDGHISGTANDGTNLIPFGPGEAYSNGDVTALAYNGAYTALAGLDALTPGDIGAAPTGHTHTPAQVGAYPALGSTYSGHVNDLREPGAYRIGSTSLTAANGYPWTPDTTGYVIVHAYSTSYLTQEVISELGTVWRRNTVAGSTTTWRDWIPVAVDTGWRSVPLENGWTGNLYLRWRNGYVTYTVTNLNGSAAANANLVSNVGGSSAFYAGAGRPTYGLGALSSPTAAPSGSTIGSIAMTGGPNNNILRASSPTSSWVNGAASVTFAPMSTTLPTTLPGTPA